MNSINVLQSNVINKLQSINYNQSTAINVLQSNVINKLQSINNNQSTEINVLQSNAKWEKVSSDFNKI